MIIRPHTINYYLSFFYILPYVFYRTRHPLPEWELYNITLPLELGMIFSVFFLGIISNLEDPTRIKFFSRKIIFCFFLLFIFLVLWKHSLGMALIYNDGDLRGQMTNLVRMTIYIFATAIFAKFYFEHKIFYKMLFGFSLWLVVLTLLFRFINPSWFSGFGYGYSRPMGTLSEPSAFAPLVAFLFFSSCLKKHIVGVISSLLLIYYLSSGVVLIVFFCTAAAFLIALNKRVLTILIILFIPVGIFSAERVSTLIDENYLLSRVSSAITETNIEKKQGGTARLTTLFNLYGELAKDDRKYFGRGLNSAKAFFGNTWEYREFSLLHVYLFSFGLVGLFVMLSIVFLASVKVYAAKNMEFLVMFFPFLTASLINSAEGTILHKFAYLFILVILMNFHQIKNRPLNIKKESDNNPKLITQ